jgi:hypothetical protein
MKLYLFDPNDWGMRYFVMAENKIEAHKYLLKHFQKQIDDEEIKSYRWLYKADLKMWKKVNPLDASTFPQKYTLNEYEAGTVIGSELS